MDYGLTETQRMIRQTIREYLTRVIEPLVPDMEAGKLLPYGPTREMMGVLGLIDSNGELATLIAESPPEEQLKRFVPRVLGVEMGRVCGGMSLAYGTTTALAAPAIRRKGSLDQKKRWADPLSRLEKIGSWCLTEPQAGSAALRDMKTLAIHHNGHYVLNGSKTFITNAPFADIFVVYAKLRQNGAESVEAFIVERQDSGISTGPPMKKMGFRSSPTGEVFLDDCRIPEDRILTSEYRDRDHVRKSLAGERVGLQTVSYGLMERAFEIALKYARDRKQGGRPIGDYQLIQRRLARMYAALVNSRSFVFGDVIGKSILAATPGNASLGKLYVAEMASYVTTEAIHILGGNGYMEEYIVERLARDAKLIELGGGTTEIQETTIGRWLVQEYEL